MIRDAVDARYGVDLNASRAAFDAILTADPMPAEDWPAMKADLLDTYYDAP